MTAGNLYRDIPAALPQEISDCLLTAGALRIERIVSHGHCSPPGFWYDQEQAEWVLLLQGEARLELEDGDVQRRSVQLRPGDYLNIPAHVRHRVAWTTDTSMTVWLAIFY